MRHAKDALPSPFAPRAIGSLAAWARLWLQTLADQANSLNFMHFCANHLQAWAIRPMLASPSSPRLEAHPFGMESR